MYKNTVFTKRQRPLVPLLGVIVVALGAAVWLMPHDEQVTEVAGVSVYTYTPTASTTVPLQVSGVIKAADQAVIRAEANGVVTSLPAREGAYVQTGTVLAVQSAPVVSAQLALADAEALLSSTAQASAVSAATYQGAVSQIAAVSAAEIAALEESAMMAGVVEQSGQLLTLLRGATLSMVSAMDFVDDNRGLFSTSDMKLYREVLESLYDRQPNYFTNGVLYALESPDDVLRTLAILEKSDTVNPADVQQLAAVVETNLLSVHTLLQSAEKDVFDQGVMGRDDARYTEYLSQRASVIEQLYAVQQGYQGLRSAVTGKEETSVSQRANTETTALGATQAAIQAEYAVRIAAQQAAVASAQKAVVAAQLSLTQPAAPFAGVVSQVHARVGEFVSAGTPLVTLVGGGARELEVTVPLALSPLLKTGQPFVVGGVTVGYLDRFSTVGTGAGVAAVVVLSDESFVVGSTLSGALAATATADGVYSVPRGVVQFDAEGAYVRTETGDTVRVSIVYDGGDVLFVTSTQKLEEPLLMALGVTL